MSKRNGVVVFVPASALLPTCGEHWIPLGDVSRLTEPERVALALYVVAEGDTPIRVIQALAPTWEAAIAWLRINLAAGAAMRANREAVTAKRLRLLRAYAGTPDQIERFQAGTLPLGELRDLLRDVLLPETFAGVAEFRFPGRCAITYSEYKGVLLAKQWSCLTAIREEVARIPDAAYHLCKSAYMSCNCHALTPSWVTVWVTIRFAEADLEIAREYNLDAE